MDCIHFITNVCSNFFRVRKNHAFIFVKVFLYFTLFYIYTFGVNNNFYINKTRIGFIAQYRRDALFSNRILWTDEANFTPNGIFKSSNNLLWHDENPRAIR